MSLFPVNGTARLSGAGKQAITHSMLSKGHAYVAAYILLRQASSSEASEHVALQNLCQGIEVVLKSLLLLKDYDKFRPRMGTGKRKDLSHDLVTLLNVTVSEYSRRPLLSVTTELDQLNGFYKGHRLRYGNGLDLFISPHSIERKRSLRLLQAVLKLLDRELRVQ